MQYIISDSMTEKPKQHKFTLAEKIDIDCYKMFGYSPSELSEINEVLDDCDAMITYHMGNTAAISPETRNTVANLALEQDLLNIEIDDLFLTAMDHVKKVRGAQAEKKEITKQNEKEFLERLGKIKQEVRALLHKIRDYVQSLKNHKY